MHKLAEVSALVESSHRADAVRFEPLVHLHIVSPTDGVPYAAAVRNCALAHGCDVATAQVICASSFGLFQIMAYHLFSDWCPWSKSVFDFVSNTDAQTVVYLELLKHMKLPQTFAEVFASAESLNNFALHYNGPGNPSAYAQAMKNAAITLHYLEG